MLPFILAAVGGYFIGDSIQKSVFADGGEIKPYKNATNNELAEYIVYLTNCKVGTDDADELSTINKIREEVKEELQSRKKN